jgi:hypothetical protein
MSLSLAEARFRVVRDFFQLRNATELIREMSFGPLRQDRQITAGTVGDGAELSESLPPA